MSRVSERPVSSAGTPVAPPDLSTARAAQILQLVFGEYSRPWSFRLWNGALIHCGVEPAASVVHFKSKNCFKQLFSKMDLVAFGEAYINGDMDFEGDLFDVMERSNSLQVENLPLKSKLKVWALLRRV